MQQAGHLHLFSPQSPPTPTPLPTPIPSLQTQPAGSVGSLTEVEAQGFYEWSREHESLHTRAALKMLSELRKEHPPLAQLEEGKVARQSLASFGALGNPSWPRTSIVSRPASQILRLQVCLSMLQLLGSPLHTLFVVMVVVVGCCSLLWF